MRGKKKDNYGHPVSPFVSSLSLYPLCPSNGNKVKRISPPLLPKEKETLQ
jgi:hypothetical protein